MAEPGSLLPVGEGEGSGVRQRLPVKKLGDVHVVFGEIKHMPKWDDIPEDFKHHHNLYARAVSSWFFTGGKRDGDTLTIGGEIFRAKPDIHCSDALRAIKAVLGSFEPKHEHKEAACAYMLSEWFDHVAKATGAVT